MELIALAQVEFINGTAPYIGLGIGHIHIVIAGSLQKSENLSVCIFFLFFGIVRVFGIFCIVRVFGIFCFLGFFLILRMFCLIFLDQALYGGAVGVEVEVRNLLGQLVILFHLLVESLGIAFQRQCVGSGESVIDLLGQEAGALVTHMDRTQKPHFLTVFTGNVVEQGSCLVFGFGFLGHFLGNFFVCALGRSFQGLIKLQRQFVVLILNGMDALVVVTGSHGDTGVLVNGQVAVEFGIFIFGSQIVQERGIVPQHFANVVLHGIAKVIVELIFQIVYAAKIVTGDILPEIHIQNTG